MAFDTLEYLENGNTDFVHNLKQYDYESLIKNVRKSQRKTQIIKGFLPSLKETQPKFCFDILYDVEEFQNEAEYLFHKCYSIESLDEELLKGIINKSSFGPKYLEDNFEKIIFKFQKNIDFILKYLFDNMNTSFTLLKQLSIHKDLNIRFQFMYYLLSEHPALTSIFYNDITNYLTSFTHQNNEQLTFIPELMKMEDVCKLAYVTLSNKNFDLYQKFKSFIINNYKYNTLASELLSSKKESYNNKNIKLVDEKIALDEFKKDANTYFNTSLDYRIYILRNYSSNISNELLEKYKKEIQLFYSEEKVDYLYRKIEAYGLARKLTEYIDKYLSLSKNTTCKPLEKGSTASPYRVGDYVIKLVNTKWSYEDIICPDLYIILPNLEEQLIRDTDGVVLAGLEVQKYLEKDAQNVPKYVFTEFITELQRLGYYTTDTLINGTCGDNCRLLNDYKESGNLKAPLWFIEYPLVLVDRDRIYKLTNRYPKQLKNGY